MKYNKGLDTLRAFAVLFVIIDHWGFPAVTSPVVLFFKQYLLPDGVFGVDLFFVISGYLITSILLNVRTETASRPRITEIGVFFMRRMLRIFPIYYLLLLTLLLIKYPGVSEHIGYYATYTSNLLLYRPTEGVSLPFTWSLAVEEQFYLIWPWLILFIKDRYIKYVFPAAILIGVVSCVITHEHPPVLLFNCMFCFGIGGYYAYCKPNVSWERRFRFWLLPFFLIALATYLHWRYQHDQFWSYTTAYYRIVYGIIAMQVVILFLNNKSAIVERYFMNNRALNYIGRISYGLYLYHFVVHVLYATYVSPRLAGYQLSYIFQNFYFDYLVKFAITVAIAGLSFRFIERPFLGLKKRFEYKAG